MIQRSSKRLSLRALVVDDELPSPTAEGRAARRALADVVPAPAIDSSVSHRVLATSVVPYPPGIPMLMPGEATGPDEGPYLSYLRALSAWDRRFPGFGHDTHGVENRNGTYYVQCVLAQPRGVA